MQPGVSNNGSVLQQKEVRERLTHKGHGRFARVFSDGKVVNDGVNHMAMVNDTWLNVIKQW